MEKEFSLSERIEQLKKELLAHAKLTEAQVDGIIRLVKFMDREFIKKVEQEIILKNPKARQNLIKLHRLAGDEFSK